MGDMVKRIARWLGQQIWLIYLPLSVLYLELVLKLWCFEGMTARGFVYTGLFSGAISCLLLCVCLVLPKKFYWWSTGIALLILSLLFGTQAVYYRMFKTFLALFSMTEASGVFSNFWREALQGIYKSLPALLFIFIPFILWIVFKKKIQIGVASVRLKLSIFSLFLLLQVGATLGVRLHTAGIMNTSYLYYDTYVPELSVRYFGVLTNFRLDCCALFRAESDVNTLDTLDTLEVFQPDDTIQPTGSIESSYGDSPTQTQEPEEEYGYNVMEIDFDRLIEEETSSTLLQMHNYFANREPTQKNAYTGYFAGKNLIWIVAEGFSTWAMDETHTPTLWKLAHSGFVFENFYNPVWYVSTSDGEYTTLTSLLPRSGVWSMARSGTRYMPFGFGTLLGNEGYTCYAFHDGTATYYDRDISHPNLGYTWLADGNGLEITATWPPSDLEMIENSVGYYIDQEPFHAYYMTISGHMYYTFSGNMMAQKHQAEVQDLNLSENCKAYVACNMELDQALARLLEELEASGALENTVIVLSGDHYPYGLEYSEIEELNGGPVEENFDLYRSTLILWSGDMEEPVPVEKLCCSLDILPTLANLFGLEYDSRLLMGRDIFSNAEGMVVFGNRSFLTEYGRYNAATDVFEAAEGVEVPEEYGTEMLQEVNQMFTMSDHILDYDYYSIVLEKAQGKD
jgi:lipoteichoic acid synthase